eukprot:5454454-Pleurochrysis_carterae.AAC.1
MSRARPSTSCNQSILRVLIFRRQASFSQTPSRVQLFQRLMNCRCVDDVQCGACDGLLSLTRGRVPCTRMSTKPLCAGA